MTLLVLLASAGLAGNSVAVTAQQSAHTASVVVSERIVASASAIQHPATASLTVTERAVLAVAAQQPAARVSASVTERLILATSASQAPNVATVALAEADGVTVLARQTAPTLAATVAERFATSISAQQSPATVSLGASESFVIGIAAQQPANATANPVGPPEFAVNAAQQPATAALVLATPVANQQGGAFVGASHYESDYSPFGPSRKPGEYALIDSFRVREFTVRATQTPHTASVALDRQTIHALGVAAMQAPHGAHAEAGIRSLVRVGATQAPHRSAVAVASDPWAEDELVLASSLPFLLMAS